MKNHFKKAKSVARTVAFEGLAALIGIGTPALGVKFVNYIYKNAPFPAEDASMVYSGFALYIIGLFFGAGYCIHLINHYKAKYFTKPRGLEDIATS